VNFIAFVGEHIFGERAVIEIISQKAEYLPVMVINHKLFELFRQNFLSAGTQEPGVLIENSLVGKVIKRALHQCVVFLIKQGVNDF
jgi:hypothetical protein